MLIHAQFDCQPYSEGTESYLEFISDFLVARVWSPFWLKSSKGPFALPQIPVWNRNIKMSLQVIFHTLYCNWIFTCGSSSTRYKPPEDVAASDLCITVSPAPNRLHSPWKVLNKTWLNGWKEMMPILRPLKRISLSMSVASLSSANPRFYHTVCVY